VNWSGGLESWLRAGSGGGLCAVSGAGTGSAMETSLINIDLN
jgi:hypothetical protein